MQPFLKWAGGKRWLVDNFTHFLPRSFNRYIEPFLGSGAVYFHLEPKQATLSDINSDLIDTYKGVKHDWRGLVKELNIHQRKHNDDYYYNIRDYNPRNLTKHAARVIYLNRTCFNGIYRVNRDGFFNVPRGTKNIVLNNTDDFEFISKKLHSAQLLNSDFEKVINRAEPGDFIFADPPYTVHHNYNGFINYNEKLFSLDDQRRLASVLASARDRGVKVLSTNANHEIIRGLYISEGFYVDEVERYSSISSLSETRKNYEELIISSHPVGEW